MKCPVKHLLNLMMIAGFILMPAGRATAQVFTTLYNFTTLSGADFTNTDGAHPYAGLILSGNTLFGTASAGGANGSGAVFAVNSGGVGFTNLYSFSAVSGPYVTNSDGANPYAGLILSGNTLFGTASGGGTNGNGTVFSVNSDGTDFSNLYAFSAVSGADFTNGDGASPDAGLILSANTLYGTAVEGGTNGNGTVFGISIDGMEFTNLYNFSASSGSLQTNSDGAYPRAGLVVSGSMLYGTAAFGGTNSNGSVFAVSTNGTGFTALYCFTATSGSPATNSDGAIPFSNLTLSGKTLYGTTVEGGTNGNGTVFGVNTDGTDFTILHTFTATSGPSVTNSDGAYPSFGSLILSGGTLYGTTQFGGYNGDGTVFSVNTDGTGFTVLHAFTATTGNSLANSDGANPRAGLILSGNTLYGTAPNGGTNGTGTVFSLAYPPPELAMMQSGTNVNFTWPVGMSGFSYGGYALQFTTNLVPPSVWVDVSLSPVVVNGQNTLTIPLSGTQMFFRLSQ